MLRGFLAALWIANGLEKFGVDWPSWLLGGTGDVPGMLELMSETPIVPVAWIIRGLMLPLGSALTFPVGILEVGLGLALLAGFGLRWSGSLGALIQGFFWAGFLTSDWPFQYPLLILGHLALAMPAWLEDRPWGAPHRWLELLLGVLGIMWLYEGFVRGWMGLAAAALLAAAAVPGLRWGRALAGAGLALGLALTALAFQTEAWGNFVWAYYTVAAIHLAALAGRMAKS